MWGRSESPPRSISAGGVIARSYLLGRIELWDFLAFRLSRRETQRLFVMRRLRSQLSLSAWAVRRPLLKGELLPTLSSTRALPQQDSVKEFTNIA